jgi:RNA polymerase sigma factor (sigma-70 family)
MACASVRPRCAEPAADLDRDALFRTHLDWAAAIACNVHRKMPPSFELDDLVQSAYIELWKRTRLYDPQRNDSFQGFAYLPIRGAVLMGCRRRHYREATHFSLNTAARSANGVHRFEGTGAIASQTTLEDQRHDPEEALLASERTRTERTQLMRFLDLAADSAPEAAQIARLILLEEVPADMLAARFGVSEIAMSRRISAGLRTLRRLRGSPAAAAVFA